MVCRGVDEGLELGDRSTLAISQSDSELFGILELRFSIAKVLMNWCSDNLSDALLFDKLV